MSFNIRVPAPHPSSRSPRDRLVQEAQENPDFPQGADDGKEGSDLASCALKALVADSNFLTFAPPHAGQVTAAVSAEEQMVSNCLLHSLQTNS